MNRYTVSRWTGFRAALACVLLASPIGAARADACPSIDSWLELIRSSGGQHRLLDAAELSRVRDAFGLQADDEHRSWTSGIVTVCPDGRGLVLLNVNTGVCGIIEVPLNRLPTLRSFITLRSG